VVWKYEIYKWFLFYVLLELTWSIILQMDYCVLSKFEGFICVVDLPTLVVLQSKQKQLVKEPIDFNIE